MSGRLLALVACLVGLSTGVTPTVAAAEDGVELCVQRPVDGVRTLGHVRLVVGEVFYERRTPDDEISGQPTEERRDAVRNRKSRALLHVMPPMLRIPLSRRESWGVTVRDRVPDRQVHPDGSEYWPFECFPIPTGEAQRVALRARGDALFAPEVAAAPGRAVAFDHHFDYRHDNCTTAVCLLLADGLGDAASGTEGEEALTRFLRRETRPVRLLRRLRGWIETWHAGEEGG